MSENSKRKIVLFPANYESNVIYEHSKELKKYECNFMKPCLRGKYKCLW